MSAGVHQLRMLRGKALPGGKVVAVLALPHVVAVDIEPECSHGARPPGVDDPHHAGVAAAHPPDKLGGRPLVQSPLHAALQLLVGRDAVPLPARMDFPPHLIGDSQLLQLADDLRGRQKFCPGALRTPVARSPEVDELLGKPFLIHFRKVHTQFPPSPSILSAVRQVPWKPYHSVRPNIARCPP